MPLFLENLQAFPNASSVNVIAPTADAVVPLRVQQHSATQSGNLWTTEKADGTVLSAFSAAGTLLTLGNGVDTGGSLNLNHSSSPLIQLLVAGVGKWSLIGGSADYHIRDLTNSRNQFLLTSGTAGNAFATLLDSLRIQAGAGQTAGQLVFYASDGTTLQASLVGDAANTLALRNGANAQQSNVYGSYTDASNYWRLEFYGNWLGSFQPAVIAHGLGTGAGRNLYVGTTDAGTQLTLVTSGITRWIISPAGHVLAGANNAYDVGDNAGVSKPRSLYLGSPAPTLGSGTGYTANNSGEVRRLTSKHTLTFAALQAAATTADFTLCTLPAKTRLVAVYADVTATFTGDAIATATLQLGKTVGGAEYLVAFDAKTATIQRGLADGDLGTSINRANAVQEADLPSWSATTALSVRLTTTGANTNASLTGSVTFSIVTEILP